MSIVTPIIKDLVESYDRIAEVFIAATLTGKQYDCNDCLQNNSCNSYAELRAKTPLSISVQGSPTISPSFCEDGKLAIALQKLTDDDWDSEDINDPNDPPSAIQRAKAFLEKIQ